MARKKKETQKVEEKTFNYTSFNEFVGKVLENHNNSFCDFFLALRDEKAEYKKSVDTYFKEKIKELDETPLTRKEYDEKLGKINSEKESAVNLMADEYHQNTFYKILSKYVYYVAEKYSKNADEVENVLNFIYEKLDFYSLVFYFEEGKYYERNEEDDCYNDYYPTSYHFKHDFFSRFKPHYYAGNLLDELLKKLFS
jgi:hypothetical protein